MELNDYVCRGCEGRLFRVTKSDAPEHILKLTCATCGDIYYFGKNEVKQFPQPSDAGVYFPTAEERIEELLERILNVLTELNDKIDKR